MENFSRRLGITLNLILAALCAIWGFVAIRHFAFITAVIAFGLLLTWLFVVAMVSASKNAVIQAAFDESGTLLRPDVRIEANLLRCLGALALSGVSMFFAWVTGWLYLPLPDGVSQVFPIAFGVTGLVAGWFWFVFKRQRGSSYLLLTPEEFEFPKFGSLNSGRWDDIAAVSDELPTEARFWTPMVITMNDGSILAMDSPGSYTPKGTALIELMRFYWRHPDQRAEFTDGRALDRLQQMRG
ncbi:hypothetical protein A5722_23640 [Mycobacterium vulneris]|nr:hypothetical protein A5722_23640 [Mycolicibacterium vulneris]OCB61326.1 hypothetical protein A5729_30300 [Mycolicibacterium vulneris]